MLLTRRHCGLVPAPGDEGGVEETIEWPRWAGRRGGIMDEDLG